MSRVGDRVRVTERAGTYVARRGAVGSVILEMPEDDVDAASWVVRMDDDSAELCFFESEIVTVNLSVCGCEWEEREGFDLDTDDWSVDAEGRGWVRTKRCGA